MPEQDPLAQLRDIHLPEAISAWPPAPGWWIAGVMALLLLSIIGRLIYRSRSRNRYRTLAVKQLTHLEQYSGQPALYLQHFNQLLKQTAIAAEPTIDIAGLSGKEWLNFLDASGKTTQFSQGAGQILNDGPYAPSAPELDVPALQRLGKHWITRHDFRNCGSST
jgi:hypothetical protein